MNRFYTLFLFCAVITVEAHLKIKALALERSLPYLRVVSKQFPYMLNVIPFMPQRPAQHLAWTPELAVHANDLFRAFERRQDFIQPRVRQLSTG
jgi:hypothetical protein